MAVFQIDITHNTAYSRAYNGSRYCMPSFSEGSFN